jgi:hypothetical protein
MRLPLIASGILFLATLLAAPAQAATISIVSMHYSAAHPVPHLHYDGDTVDGDLDLLKRMYERFVKCRTACLGPNGGSTAVLTMNGPGGSYSEGLALADFLRANHIATVAERGAECYSACAFAFLGGSGYSTQDGVGTYVDRMVEPGSIVGFHAPYRNEANFRQAMEERGAMAAQGETRDSLSLMVRELVKWNVDPEVLYRMVGMGPNETYNLVTAEDLYRARVNLPPTPTSGWVQDRAEAIRNACMRLLAIDSRGEPADTWPSFLSEYTPGIGEAQYAGRLSGFRIGGDSPLDIGICAAPNEMPAAEDGDIDVSLYFNRGLSGFNQPSTSFFNRHKGWSTAGYGRNPVKRVFAKGPMNSYFLPLDVTLDALDRPAQLQIDQNRFNLALPPLLPTIPADLIIDTSRATARISYFGNLFVFERVGTRALFESAVTNGELGREYTSNVGNELSFSRMGSFTDTGHRFAWFGLLQGDQALVVEAIIIPPEGTEVTAEEREMLRRVQCETTFYSLKLGC